MPLSYPARTLIHFQKSGILLTGQTDMQDDKSFLQRYSIVVAIIVGVGVTIVMIILLGEVRRVRMPIIVAPIYAIFGKEGLSILLGLIAGCLTWLFTSDR